MPRVTKKTKAKEIVKTEEISKDSSVIFIAKKEQLSKLYTEDLIKIKKAFNVNIELKNEKFTITSINLDDCRKAAYVLEKLFAYFDDNIDVQDSDVDELILELMPKPLPGTKYKDFYRTYQNIGISPRTENQELILDTIRKKHITIIHGNAGTGKTAFSIISALKLLEENRYDKIIVIRALTTVGKEIGYLPGSLSEKLESFFGPIYSTFIDLIGEKELEQKMKEEKICFESSTFLRGANFKNSIIIVDEVQNLTKAEVLTICTRFLTSTKLIFSGDRSQTDLKRSTKDEKSGLDCMLDLLKDIKEIGFVKMCDKDNQRHKLVGEIIRAFE